MSDDEWEKLSAFRIFAKWKVKVQTQTQKKKKLPISPSKVNEIIICGVIKLKNGCFYHK